MGKTSPKTDQSWRFAIVQAVNPAVTVRLDGKSNIVTVRNVLCPVSVGDRVWVQFYGPQLAIVANASADRQVWADHARQQIYGGGVRNTTTTQIQWSKRFMATGMGRSADTATGGYFNIDQPPDGTVIPVYGKTGLSSVTVASGWVPLASWEILWYKLPFGTGPNSVPGNFFITSYTQDNFVPPDAICICIRNGDDFTARWGDGRETAPWTAITLGQSWTNYGSGFAAARYKREMGIVYLEGLIKTGTVGSTAIFTFPVGYRPDSTILFVGASSGGLAGLRVFSSGGFAVYELYSGTTASVSITCQFQADQ